METHGRLSTSTGSTYSLLTAYREPVVTIGNASDIDPLTVEIRCIHVGAARGDPHVRAGEIVQTQRWVGASVPGAPSTEIARTVRVGVAHTPRAFLSALHGAPYCGIARVSGAQRTSRSCGRPPAYPPTRRPRRCTGCAVRSAHSCRNASAGGTRASSSHCRIWAGGARSGLGWVRGKGGVDAEPKTRTASWTVSLPPATVSDAWG